MNNLHGLTGVVFEGQLYSAICTSFLVKLVSWLLLAAVHCSTVTV